MNLKTRVKKLEKNHEFKILFDELKKKYEFEKNELKSITSIIS